MRELDSFAWMPDSQHIILSLSFDQNAPTHLWMADIKSNYLVPLTIGNVSESSPKVSPNGRNILYAQRRRQLDVVSISIKDGSTTTSISTGRVENMAAWSAKVPKLAWVTNRNGPYEIWLRMPDGSERPAVAAADFPPGSNKWFMNPSPSPDGDRLIYGRIDQAGVARLWISSLSGGAPIRLTHAEPSGGESGGSWSPDGTRIAYIQILGSNTSLMMAKATGNAAPVLLKGNGPPLEDTLQGAPEWSPTGEWITYRDKKGWNLISPDGKRSKFLGNIKSPYLAFSKDGKLLYGIRSGETETDRDRAMLFSLNPITLKQKSIKELGSDFRPDPLFVLGIRFSFSPDGKSFVYSTGKYRSDLWMLQGYRQPSWADRLRATFSRRPDL
jgi:Tol biopolymer transport system component